MKRKLFVVGLFALCSFVLASCNLDLSKSPFGNNDLMHIHDYSHEKIVVEPTCEADGYTINKCSCGAQVLSDRVNKLGHHEVKDEGYPKTCTTDGLTEGSHCDRCGHVFKAQEKIPASHEWDYEITTEPTCTKPGVSVGLKCKICGEVSDGATEVPALGHNYEHKKETTKYGHSHTVHKCTRCDDTYVDSLEVDYTKNYDYMMLSTNSMYEEHRSEYLSIYKALYEGCNGVFNSTKNYTLENSKGAVVASASFDASKITNDEAYAITDSFIKNNPQFYFLNSYMVISSGVFGSKVSVYIDNEYLKASKRKEAQDNIKLLEQEFYKEYLKNPSMSEAEKAKLIHDYIIAEIDYQYDNMGRPASDIISHSIMGVADHNSKTGGVCECYSKTYLYLSHLIGLNSIMVLGTGGGGAHGWNYTEIDGKWYGVDVTWDDQSYGMITKYFLASKSTMDEGHQAGTPYANTDLEVNVFQVVLPTLEEVAYS